MEAVLLGQRLADVEAGGGRIHNQFGFGLREFDLQPVAVDVLHVGEGRLQRQRGGRRGGQNLAGLRILTQQRQHGMHGRLGLVANLCVNVLGRRERPVDALDLMGRRHDTQPCLLNVRICRIDVVGALQLRALRGVHGVDAQGAAADQMGARGTGIGGLGPVEGFKRQPGLPLTQLDFGQRGERGGRMRIRGNGCIRLCVCLRDFVFMQQRAHQRRGKIRVLRAPGQRLPIQALRIRIAAFAVCRVCGRGCARGNRRTRRSLRAHNGRGAEENCDDPTDLSGARERTKGKGHKAFSRRRFSEATRVYSPKPPMARAHLASTPAGAAAPPPDLRYTA